MAYVKKFILHLCPMEILNISGDARSVQIIC